MYLPPNSGLADKTGVSDNYSAGFRHGFCNGADGHARAEWAAGYYEGFAAAQQRCGPTGSSRPNNGRRPDESWDSSHAEPSYIPPPPHDEPLEVMEDDPHFRLRPSDEFVPFDEDEDNQPGPSEIAPPAETTPLTESPAETAPPDLPPREIPSAEPAADDPPVEFDTEPVPPPMTPAERSSGDLDLEPATDELPDMNLEPAEPADSELDFDDLFLDDTGAIPNRRSSGLAGSRQMQPAENPRSNEIRFRDSPRVVRGQRGRPSGNVQRVSHEVASDSRQGGPGNRSWRAPQAVTRMGHSGYYLNEPSYRGQFKVDQNQEVVIEDLD